MSIKEQQLDTRSGFKQEMQTRHIVMLALGGVIGTGLFSRPGIRQPCRSLGAVIAYIIGALMVYMVMMCLGELAVQMPETRFIQYVRHPVSRAGYRVYGGLVVLADLDGGHRF